MFKCLQNHNSCSTRTRTTYDDSLRHCTVDCDEALLSMKLTGVKARLVNDGLLHTFTIAFTRLWRYIRRRRYAPRESCMAFMAFSVALRTVDRRRRQLRYLSCWRWNCWHVARLVATMHAWMTGRTKADTAFYSDVALPISSPQRELSYMGSAYHGFGGGKFPQFWLTDCFQDFMVNRHLANIYSNW